MCSQVKQGRWHFRWRLGWHSSLWPAPNNNIMAAPIPLTQAIHGRELVDGARGAAGGAGRRVVAGLAAQVKKRRELGLRDGSRVGHRWAAVAPQQCCNRLAGMDRWRMQVTLPGSPRHARVLCGH